MKAVVAAFNQEKALVGAFSVITNLRMQLFEALQQARDLRYHRHLLQLQLRQQRLLRRRVRLPVRGLPCVPVQPSAGSGVEIMSI